MKNLCLFTVLILLLAACGDSGTDKENLKEDLKEEFKEKMANETDNETKKAPDYTIDDFVLKGYSAKMAAQVDYKGDVLKGKAWQDANGKNFVIFTKMFDKEKADRNGVKDKFLYAYHFADKGDGYKKIRMIKDWEKECDLINHAEFRFKTLNITDRDRDNKAEITFIYRLGCNMDPTPVPMKLMMLEDGEKYAIRGKTAIERMNIADEMNVDPSFNEAPDEFLSFAKEIWESDKEYFIDQISREEFEAFWKKFQNIVANDDIDAFMHLCTSECKSRFGKVRYERFFDARMKEEIKNTTVNDIRGNNKKKQFGFMENNSLISIFFIKGVDGKWRIAGTGAAG